MKFLATQTRSIRNPQTGRVSQVIKGSLYTITQAKPFFKNGSVPEFLVDGNLSHFERFVRYRPEFLEANGYQSCVYLAVCKAIVEFFGGDTKALRAFANGGGTVQMAMKMERDYGSLLGIEYVEKEHEANDPLAKAHRVYQGLYPCTKSQEDMIIGLTLAELASRY
jgi:hypothetical protein